MPWHNVLAKLDALGQYSVSEALVASVLGPRMCVLLGHAFMLVEAQSFLMVAGVAHPLLLLCTLQLAGARGPKVGSSRPRLHFGTTSWLCMMLPDKGSEVLEAKRRQRPAQGDVSSERRCFTLLCTARTPLLVRLPLSYSDRCPIRAQRRSRQKRPARPASGCSLMRAITLSVIPGGTRRSSWRQLPADSTCGRQ